MVEREPDPDAQGSAAPIPVRPVAVGGQVLSYQSPAAPITWVTLMSCPNTIEADLAVTMLQSHGLHARVDMQNSAGLGLYGGVVCGTKIQVLAEEHDAARAFMDEVEARRAKRLAATKVTCPNCKDAPARMLTHPIRRVAWACVIGSIAIPMLISLARVSDSPRSVLWLLLFPLGLILMVWNFTPRWRCVACGHRWSQAEFEQDDAED